MGLFDSKKVKEEKEIYQNLFKNNLLPYGITEKEFLKPSSKEVALKKASIITRYKQTMEIINNVEQIKQTPSVLCNNIYDYFLRMERYDLNDFVDCYKFLESKHEVYEYYKKQGNENIIDFIISFDDIYRKYGHSLRNQIDGYLTEERKKSEENTKRFYQMNQEYAQRRNQIANGPGMRAMRDRASETARQLSMELKDKGYDASEKNYKYDPYCDDRHTQEELDAKTYSERDQLIENLKSMRDSVKSERGHRGR